MINTLLNIGWPFIFFIFNVVLLAFALWIMASDDSPFDEYGVRNTWARCFALAGTLLGFDLVFFFLVSGASAGRTGISVVLIFLGLRIIVWLVGCMVLFGLNVGRAVLLALVCWTVEYGVLKLFYGLF